MDFEVYRPLLASNINVLIQLKLIYQVINVSCELIINYFLIKCNKIK